VSRTTAWYFCNLFSNKSPSLTNFWYWAFLLSGRFVSTVPNNQRQYQSGITINPVNNAVQFLGRNKSAEIATISKFLTLRRTRRWILLWRQIVLPCSRYSNFDNSPRVGHMLSASFLERILLHGMLDIYPSWGVVLLRPRLENMLRTRGYRVSWWDGQGVPRFHD
jgi:hypothetical protein